MREAGSLPFHQSIHPSVHQHVHTRASAAASAGSSLSSRITAPTSRSRRTRTWFSSFQQPPSPLSSSWVHVCSEGRVVGWVSGWVRLGWGGGGGVCWWMRQTVHLEERGRHGGRRRIDGQTGRLAECMLAVDLSVVWSVWFGVRAGMTGGRLDAPSRPAVVLAIAATAAVGRSIQKAAPILRPARSPTSVALRDCVYGAVSGVVEEGSIEIEVKRGGGLATVADRSGRLGKAAHRIVLRSSFAIHRSSRVCASHCCWNVARLGR